MEENQADLQLNIVVSGAGSQRSKFKKTALSRKLAYNRKLEKKKKRFERKPKKAEKRPNFKQKKENPNRGIPNFKQKKEKPNRGRPEEPAFADNILRREVVPTIHEAEGKYVFNTLKELSSTKSQRKVNNVRQNTNISVNNRNKKANDKDDDVKTFKSKELEPGTTSNATSGEFAAFVKKKRKFSNTLPNSDTNVVKPTGRFIRKAKSSGGVDVRSGITDNTKAFANFVKKPKSKSVAQVSKVTATGDSIASFKSKPNKSASLDPADDHTVNINPTEFEDFDFDAFNQSEPLRQERTKRLDESSEDGDADFRRRKKAKREKQFTEDGVDGPFKGKYTSLFGNNPEIPRVAMRAVRPVQEPVFSNETFADLNIHKFHVSNLASLGLTRLTTVQRKAVPPLLEGRDALVRSQTGSGKTLAYALPLVELLQRQRPALTRVDGIRALVVLPTRELALQTYECFLKLVKPFMRLVPGCLVGGEKRKSEKARLRKGITILVGTPGRILDHVQHTRAVHLRRVQYLVLDEADRLLDMGYERDIASIVHALETQTSPLLPKSALEWNRSTFGVNEDEDEDSGDNNPKPKRIIFNSDESAEESPEDDVETSKNAKKTNEKSTKFSTHPGHSEKKDEGNSSDYDAEILADDVISMKRKKKKRRKSDEADNEDSDDDSESEEGDAGRPSKQTHRGVAEMSEEDGDGGAAPARPPKQPGRWQTVLLSATLTPAVERLAGLALRAPTFVDAADVDAAAETPDIVIPHSLTQKYVVVPAKLRLVTLSAFIAWKCTFTDERKILLFCATLDMVNYLTELLTVALGQSKEDADDSDDEDSPNLNIEFFRLHGDMEQKERTHVFQTFRAADCGVLLCTDVAARGLDMPRVDWIVQYTAPGSVADYVHRVGRTARVGAVGSALLFLLPSEVGFVEVLQGRRIRLREEHMDTCLQKWALASSSQSYQQKPSISLESAATSLQLRYENAVLDRRSLHDLAVKAFVSFVRFYATYPRDMSEVFCFKALHLGHAAKSFALRDAPSSIGGIGRRRFQAAAAEQPEKRLNQKLQLELLDVSGAPAPAGGKRPKDWMQRGKGKDKGRGKGKFFGKPGRQSTRDLVLSEFASGLEPLQKKKERGAR